MPQRKICNASFESLCELEIFTKNIKGSSVEFCTGKALDFSNLIGFLASTGIIELVFKFSSHGIVIIGKNEEKNTNIRVEIPKSSLEKYCFHVKKAFYVGVRTADLVPIVPSFAGETMIVFFINEDNDSVMNFISISLDRSTRDEITYDDISTLDIDMKEYRNEEKKENDNAISAVVEIDSSRLYVNYTKHKTKYCDLIVEENELTLLSETENSHKKTHIGKTKKGKAGLRYIKRHVAEDAVVSFRTETKVVAKLLKGLKALKLEDMLTLKFGENPSMSLECEIGTLAMVKINFDQQKN